MRRGALAFLACLWLCHPAHAQSAGNPKQSDGASCPFFMRFTDNGNGTVTNPRTGLMWKHCPEGASWNGKVCSDIGTPMNWVQAMKAAKASRYAGHSDWRLPTIAELQSTKAEFCESDMVPQATDNATKLKNSIEYGFWSSTTWQPKKNPSPSDAESAWRISFWGLSWAFERSVNFRTRLVRASRPEDTSRQEFDAEYAKIDQYQKMVNAQNRETQAFALDWKRNHARLRAAMAEQGEGSASTANGEWHKALDEAMSVHQGVEAKK
jgi:Protein of unknown function (DUF1566)